MRSIAPTAVIHPNVQLGENVVIEDYCIIGAPGVSGNEEMTVIGDDAVIRSHTVIYAGNRIGAGFRAGNKVNIRELNTIGSNVSIGTLSVVEHHVVIEDNVRIHTQAFIPEYSVLRQNCWIGPHVVLTNARYPRSPNAKNELSGVTVERNAKLGANATVLPGVTIGENSLVGAGSVVVKNVARDTIVAGNPAKKLRSVPYR